MPTKEPTVQNNTALPPDDPTFRLLFHHHPIPMWIYSPKTLAFLEVNDAAMQKYGYSRAEFLQMTLKDIRPPEELPRLLADVAQPRPALQQSGVWRHCLKDGAVIDVEISSHTLHYQGRPAVLVQAQDITRRVRTENELRQKSEALENSLNGFDIVSADGKFLYANRAYLRMWGYNSLDEIVGTSPAGHCLNPDIPRQIINTLEEKGECRLEFTALRKDGSTFEALMFAQKVVDANGQETYQGTSLDITEQKRAEAALLRSEARLARERTFLRTLINTIPDLVWLKDINGVYLSCNPAFARFFGAPIEAIPGKTDYDFVPPDLADFFRENDRAALAAGGPRVNEEWIPHAEYNRQILVETIKTPMLGANGQPIGVLGIARDITATRQAQEAVREREAKLNTLFEILPVGVSVLGADSNVTYANPALMEILGVSFEGLSRGHHRRRRYLRPDGSPMPAAELPRTRVFADRQPINNVEFGVEKEDGAVTWMN